MPRCMKISIVDLAILNRGSFLIPDSLVHRKSIQENKNKQFFILGIIAYVTYFCVFVLLLSNATSFLFYIR
jgi:hypothetical protein